MKKIVAVLAAASTIAVIIVIAATSHHDSTTAAPNGTGYQTWFWGNVTLALFLIAIPSVFTLLVLNIRAEKRKNRS